MLHTFLDFPKKSDVTHYLEICCNEVVNFDVTLAAGARSCDVVEFYRDQRASEAMYADYQMIDSAAGSHLQSVGGLQLLVSPCSAQIVNVAPPGGPSEVCFNTKLTPLAQIPVAGSPIEDGSEPSFGAWLKLESIGGLNWNQTSRNHVTLEFQSAGCKVLNFYWFAYLPSRFEARDETFFVETNSASMQGRQADPQSIMRFELSPTFAVYSDWAKVIYTTAILKNRRSVEFGSQALARLSFMAVDEAFAARISTWSFFLGVTLSLLGNALIATIFLGIQTKFTWVEDATIGALALAMGIVLYLSRRYLAK